jgi:thiosulfate reductase cytochrome b subunit
MDAPMDAAVDRAGTAPEVAPVRAGERRLRNNRILTYRHGLITRLTHWVNVICLIVLLMSGLQIFNAHPALYWGQQSTFADPAFAIGAIRGDETPPRGVTLLFGHQYDTTGVLGVSTDAAGRWRARAFPGWITLPSYQSLADGRLWHFFFAWVFAANFAVYAVASLLGGHFWRDLWPGWRDLGHLPRAIWDHARLRFPKGEAARRYNVLQRLTYLLVVGVLFPVIILAGLAMSPRMDAAWPWLLDLFGGRQSARTIHFICAMALVAFVAIHLLMVLLSGPLNNLRSMITGRYAIDAGSGRE